MNWIKGLCLILIGGVAVYSFRKAPQTQHEPEFVPFIEDDDLLLLTSETVRPGCKHEFGAWRNFPDGKGGDRACKYCGRSTSEIFLGA